MRRRAPIWIGFVVVATALAIDLVHRRDPIGVDFHTYLAAALVGLHHGWSHIYDQDVVALQQHVLQPSARLQPFLSPPTAAWITAAVAWLPYDTAYTVWAFFTFLAFAGALAWAGTGRGVARWVPVVGALAPWWVMHAVNVGQVVPLVAASTVVAWKLLRDKHDVAAGLVLSLILLKPNTAFLVPVALVFAGRYRAIAAWVGSGAVLALVAAFTLGPHGLSAYAGQLTGSLPSGADNLTLHGAFGIDGASAIAVRFAVVAVAMGVAYRSRHGSTLFVPVAAVGSLVISPYLHASDLCVLSAAAWMAWEELPVVLWRASLALAWVGASPFLFVVAGVTPRLQQWPIVELVFFGALAFTAWRPLTARADLRRRAAA